MIIIINFSNVGAGDNGAEVSEGADGYDGNRQHHKGHRGEFSYRRGGRGQFRRGRGGRGGYNNQRYQQLEDSEEAGGDGAVGVRMIRLFWS
jgi:hypothetical protein